MHVCEHSDVADSNCCRIPRVKIYSVMQLSRSNGSVILETIKIHGTPADVTIKGATEQLRKIASFPARETPYANI
jgi:hypothetical protein